MRQKAAINDVLEGQLFLTGPINSHLQSSQDKGEPKFGKLKGPKNEGCVRNVPWDAGTAKLLSVCYEACTGHKARLNTDQRMCCAKTRTKRVWHMCPAACFRYGRAGTAWGNTICLPAVNGAKSPRSWFCIEILSLGDGAAPKRRIHIIILV